MKAFVYQEPGETGVEERWQLEVAAPAGAIVRITETSTCGTDPLFLKVNVPICRLRRILVDEGVASSTRLSRTLSTFNPDAHLPA